MIRKASFAIIIALFSVSAMAQSVKFGHVNSQVILSQMPEYKKANKQLVSLDSMYKSEEERLQVEINKKVEAYYNDSISPQLVKDVKAQEIQELQTRFQQFQQRAQQDLQTQMGKLMQPIYAKVMDAINEIAADKKLVYVFDVSQGNPLYVSDQSVDLVPEVLKKFGIDFNPNAIQQQEMQQQQPAVGGEGVQF